MSFSDRLRAWFRGESVPERAPSSDVSHVARRRGPGPQRRPARDRRRQVEAAAQLPELEEFARTRQGVEVYLEPRTRLYGESVLLVADDGEYLRRPVPDVATARAFCSRLGLPCYDAARTGYPRRVRDYDRGVRPDRIALEDLPPWPDSDAAGGTDDDGPPPPPPV